MGLTNFLNLGKVQIGNEAAVASAINKLRAADLYLSSILSKLFRVENEFNTVATQAVAESTRKAAENESWKTLTDAIATGLGGVFQIGGAIGATAMEHSSNPSRQIKKKSTPSENIEKLWMKETQVRLCQMRILIKKEMPLKRNR